MFPKPREIQNELLKKGRNGNYFLLENYRGWKISYPYPMGSCGYVGFMLWNDDKSVSCIVGERFAQGLHMPLWIEPDCCGGGGSISFDNLDELIDHLEECEDLKKEPNYLKR